MPLTTFHGQLKILWPLKLVCCYTNLSRLPSLGSFLFLSQDSKSFQTLFLEPNLLLSYVGVCYFCAILHLHCYFIMHLPCLRHALFTPCHHSKCRVARSQCLIYLHLATCFKVFSPSHSYYCQCFSLSHPYESSLPLPTFGPLFSN